MNNDNRKHPAKHIILLLVFALLIQGSFLSAFAEGEESGTVIDQSGIMQNAGYSEGIFEAGSDVAEKISRIAEDTTGYSFIDKDLISSLKLIRYPFLDTRKVAFDWHFPYADKFFRRDSDKFSISLAQSSLGLALSAFRSTPDVVDPQYETFLTGAGFTDLYPFGFDKETTEDSLSGVIGMKKIDDFTVIAAVTCGQGYQNEWAGNLKVGTGERHEGFNNAAQLLEGYIDQYIEDKSIEGKKKLWLTGISRAAAVGNITAADMIEGGEFEDVYAYLFGVPRTTRNPVRYEGIYNICGQYDPVASVPLQSWGYERYGTDFYTPAQEAETSYKEFSSKADKVSMRLENKPFRNNPEINYQLHLILSFMSEFFPTAEDYATRFQDELIYAWTHHDSDQLSAIIESAMAKVAADDPQEKSAQRVFIDYISFIAAQHMRYEQRQVTAGSWNPDESLAANVALEHRPSTYVNWLFSSIDPKDMLTSSDSSRRLTLVGDFTVTAFKDGVPITEIDPKGTVSIPAGAEKNSGEILPELFMMKNGKETVVSLPADEEYYVQIRTDKDTSLTYFDVFVSPEKLEVQDGQIKLCSATQGTYGITVSPGKELPEPDTTEGKLVCYGSYDIKYSPTVIMSNELSSTRFSFLSLSNALILMAAVTGFLILLGLICLIVALVHGIKKRRGHAPYSDWYVITPHILCIMIFAGMTQFLTFFMFSIGKARVSCAVICVIFIFLLALRGSLRGRTVAAFIFTLFVFALIPLTNMYYNRLPISGFSRLNMSLYFSAVSALTAMAVLTFRRKKTKADAEQS